MNTDISRSSPAPAMQAHRFKLTDRRARPTIKAASVRVRFVRIVASSQEAARLGLVTPPDELVEAIGQVKAGWFETRPGGEEIGELFEALGGALNSGAGMDEALELAAQGARSAAMRGIVGELRLSVRNGSPLADGMSRFQRAFPPMVVAMLRAAETAGGELGRALLALAERRRKEGRLKRKMVNALAYPAIVLLLTCAAALVLQIRALPPMVENFKMLGATLPLPTRILYACSQILISHGPWLALGAGIAAVVLARPFRKAWASESVQRVVIRTPLAGPVLRAYCLVRALNTFALLKGCGATTEQQFRHAAEASGNPVYQRFFNALHQRVVSGEELHAACLAERDLLPDEEAVVLAARLRIGAFSGDGARLLQNLADDLTERADLKAGLLPQMIEVPLLLVCGSVIGGIILAMLLPMPGLVIDMLKRPGGF